MSIESSGARLEQAYEFNLLTKQFLVVSHTYTFLKPDAEKFIPNMTSNENRMEIRRNWDLLMPCKLPFS